jgi:xanthine dehydrogenase YagT iron-sulfur-binding subunit
VVVAGDGHVLARHSLSASDQLSALADGLGAAGREVLAQAPSVLLSRREVVLASLVGAFALLALDGCRHRGTPSAASALPAPASRSRQITLNINGQLHALEVEPRVSLLDALRERLALTGSKKGCDHGQCGACTVLVDGRRVNACLTLAVMVGDAPITTIEGLAKGDALHPMQAAFVEQDALQCGYCTPGQIMSALGLVRENRAHSDAEVREHMSGNICRCGAYPNIVAAIQRGRGGTAPG